MSDVLAQAQQRIKYHEVRGHPPPADVLSTVLAEALRLQVREATLVALLERTWPFLAGYQCDSMQEGDKLTALEREIEKVLAAQESGR